MESVPIIGDIVEDLFDSGLMPNWGSSFGEFYLKYSGPFISKKPIPELYDLVDSTSILDSIAYVKDRYKFSDSFIALTSDELEGMYLYNKDNGSVYDFDLGQYEDFIAGKKQTGVELL